MLIVLSSPLSHFPFPPIVSRYLLEDSTDCHVCILVKWSPDDVSTLNVSIKTCLNSLSTKLAKELTDSTLF